MVRCSANFIRVVAVKDVPGQIQLTLVPGDTIKLDQRQLDLRMPGNDRLFWGGPVIRHQEVVDETDAGVEQFAVAGRPVVCNRSLQHVSDVIKFVPGRLRFREHSLRLVSIHVIGVEIAARFLRGDNLVNHFLHGGAKLWTVARLQHEARGLNPLVNIGVGIYGPALGGRTFPRQAAKIVHAAVRLQQIVHAGNALVDVSLAPLRPEAALDGDRVHRNISQLGVRRFGKILDPLVLPSRTAARGRPSRLVGCRSHFRLRSGAGKQPPAGSVASAAVVIAEATNCRRETSFALVIVFLPRCRVGAAAAFSAPDSACSSASAS